MGFYINLKPNPCFRMSFKRGKLQRLRWEVPKISVAADDVGVLQLLHHLTEKTCVSDQNPIETLHKYQYII